VSQKQSFGFVEPVFTDWIHSSFCFSTKGNGFS